MRATLGRGALVALLGAVVGSSCVNLDEAYDGYCRMHACDGGPGFEVVDAGSDGGTDAGVGDVVLTLTPLFTTAVAAGDCVGFALDATAAGQPAPVDLPIQVGGDSLTTYFDSTCSNAISTVVIPHGSSVTFGVMTTAAGSHVVTADDPNGVLASASHALDVIAATPVAPITFTVPPDVFPGDCVPLQLNVVDRYGNPPVGRPELLTLTPQTLSLGGFTPRSDCLALDDVYSAPIASPGQPVIYWQPYVAQTNNFTVHVVTSPTISVTNSISVSTLALQLSPANALFVKGTCQTYTVQPVRGTSGVTEPFPAPTALAVAVTGNASAVTDCINRTPLTGSVNVADQTPEFTFGVLSNNSGNGTVTVTPTDTSVYSSGNSSFTMVAQAVRLSLRDTPTTIAKDTCSPGSVSVLDGSNNDVGVIADTQVSLIAEIVAGFNLYAEDTCTDADPSSTISVTIPRGRSAAPFWMKSANSGTANLSAISDPLASTSTAVTVP